MQLKNKFIIAVLIVLSVIAVLSLIHPGFPITHDGQDHVARIANFYLNLSQGNLIPRWASNLNWGYGHPILEFLYPLPSYTASFFHALGLSLVDSTKIVFGLGMVLSFIFMYFWLSQFSSKYASLMGAFLYAYAPYRFVDLYVRGDIGENLAFAIIPLVMLVIYRVYKKQTFTSTVIGGVSLALLILSHNAVSLMALPLILFYSVYLIYISKKRKTLIVNLLSLITLGFLLSAFFWIPALLEGKYTLRDILTKGSFVGRFVSFGQLIYGNWNYGQSGQFTVQLGILQWVSLIASPVVAYKLFKNKDKAYIFVLGLTLLCLSGIFLMLPASAFIWNRVMFLQNFQFPWRFLTVTVVVTSVLSVFLFDFIPEKYRKLALIIAIALVLIVQKDYLGPKGYQYKPESFYSGVYDSTTDTGESSPIWSVRFMEVRPKAHLEVLDGKATVKQIKRTATDHIYTINVTKKTLFEENTLYFPGWEIKANNLPVNIQFQNMQYRGVMLFFLNKGNYVVTVKYSETKLRLISDVTSFVSLFIILCFITIRFVKKRIY